MTTPGGLKTGGLTVVGVLPTHRRNGILTKMMRKHLENVCADGQAISALWASEAPIYGRYGYGLAWFYESLISSVTGPVSLHQSSAREELVF